MAKKLKSVFTDDMNSCIFTGSPYVERHHIFYNTSGMRNASEYYGFVVPLRYDLHPNGVRADRRYSKQIDEYLKKMAQEYFEDNIGDRDTFRNIFGKSYL